MKSSNLLRVAFTALAVTVAACSSTPAKDTDKDKSAQDKPLAPVNPFRADSADKLASQERKLGAEGLYRQARLALDSSDFSTAISRYGQIAARFPFTEYATQADLERVYALYRSFQPDDALTAADKFLKEHPRHPAADYVQYIKGLTNTSRDEGLSGTFGLDNTKEDVSYLRRSFDDFSLLAQKYPNSPYAGDARQHMIDLRNRIAQHDLHVVHYYVKRGAFIAAAKRAEQILLQYPGAPATIEAMQILEKCYAQMGLNDQAADVHKLLVAQLAMPTPQTDYPVAPKKPGLFDGVYGLFSSSKTQAAPAPAALPTPAPVVTPQSAVAPTAAPAVPAAEAPTFSNWFFGLFSTEKSTPAAASTPITVVPADNTAAPAAVPASDSGSSKPAADQKTAAPAAKENKTPTLMDLLYHSVVPDKKADDGSAPADSKDSKPATTP